MGKDYVWHISSGIVLRGRVSQPATFGLVSNLIGDTQSCDHLSDVVFTLTAIIMLTYV